jgi:hypothetical protein
VHRHAVLVGTKGGFDDLYLFLAGERLAYGLEVVEIILRPKPKADARPLRARPLRIARFELGIVEIEEMGGKSPVVNALGRTLVEDAHDPVLYFEAQLAGFGVTAPCVRGPEGIDHWQSPSWRPVERAANHFVRIVVREYARASHWMSRTDQAERTLALRG